jgi:hypothetical protein
MAEFTIELERMLRKLKKDMYDGDGARPGVTTRLFLIEKEGEVVEAKFLELKEFTERLIEKLQDSVSAINHSLLKAAGAVLLLVIADILVRVFVK